jgi:hypothetical protein
MTLEGVNMIIDNSILDELTAKAKENSRLRCNLDLRNSAEDKSQRMLNAIEPGAPEVIHRHRYSSETVVCLRGRVVGILRKTLLKNFSTQPLSANFANYEGMCVGPTLSDGSKTLVLIPDSQNGSSGLTKEYVKVITFK